MASCCTKCFICKIQTYKFCRLKNITDFQSDKDICVLCIGQAQNWAKAVGGNRQQTPRFQLSSPVSCLLLALFWFLGFWTLGLVASWRKRKAGGVLPSLSYTSVVRPCSSVYIVAGSQGRSSHFPPKGQQHFCLLEEILPLVHSARGHLHLTEMSQLQLWCRYTCLGEGQNLRHIHTRAGAGAFPCGCAASADTQTCPCSTSCLSPGIPVCPMNYTSSPHR